MTDTGVPKNVDKFARKPPRQRGNTDIMPFKAPRRLSSGSDVQEIMDKTPPDSDTTGSTPEMFRSPELIQDRVPGSIVQKKTVEAKTKAPRRVKGWVYIPETEDQEEPVQDLVLKVPELQDSSGLIDDRLNQTATSLTIAQMKDFKEGPLGQNAVGVTVCKEFDGVQFQGKVESFRQVRQRFYYHIIYSDGDEEDMSQIELRDAYLLANTELIEAEWSSLKSLDNGKEAIQTEDETLVASSDEEGSEYDRHDYESEVKQTKRKRKELMKKAKKPKKNELSGIILPQCGDKTVAGEAFAKLNKAQKKNVAEKVNKKTKQVLLLYQIAIAQMSSYPLCSSICNRQLAKKSVREQIFDVGHQDAVKERLRLLLTSEMVPITEMHHEGITVGLTIEDEGMKHLK